MRAGGVGRFDRRESETDRAEPGAFPSPILEQFDVRRVEYQFLVACQHKLGLCLLAEIVAAHTMLIPDGLDLL